MTRSEVAKSVRLLGDYYPQATISDGTSHAYERALVDLAADNLVAAIELIVQTSRFFPTVAELREAATKVRLGPVRTGEEAWGDVVLAIRHVGIYRPAPRFKDNIVGQCVSRMGWQSLCKSGNDISDRARFCQLYETLAKRRRESEITGVDLTNPQLNNSQRLRKLTQGVGRWISATPNHQQDHQEEAE